MSFRDSKSFKKGIIGERYIAKMLQNKGYTVYSDLEDERETADIISMRDNKIFIFHVKRKERRRNYQDTGIDKRHLCDYMDVYNKNNIRSWLIFIDEHPESMCIFMIELTKFAALAEERSRGICYVNLNEMKIIKRLKDKLA